ncbi:MAG: hemerythrin domain-containing protein [Acidimicrobiales bacterium]|nr:hemerythrin domain-containing protein [Acidimicrobiales bacterium]
MPDVAELLKQDHRKVEDLFEQYQAGSIEVIPRACAELKVHTAIEEEVVYPVLAEVSDGRRLREEAEHEHGEVEQIIAQIERNDPDTAETSSLMTTLIEGVTHHVQEEEDEVLPKMAAELGEDRMNALGEQLVQAKRRQLSRTGGLGELTKEELYELAQGSGIKGRSEMSKEELVNALTT